MQYFVHESSPFDPDVVFSEDQSRIRRYAAEETPSVAGLH
jgi:hypothetical protein